MVKSWHIKNGITGIMTNENKNVQVKNNKNQLLIWILALVIGAFAGCLGISKLNNLFNFLANIYTRLFQFVAIPTIALAVITTLSKLGAKKSTGRILHTRLFIQY